MSMYQNPLPNDEVIALLKKYRKDGDLKSRNKIVMANMKAVYLLANKYRSYYSKNHVSFDDLVADGAVGLMEAIDKFDVKRDVNFITYAYWWIMKRITDNASLGTLNMPNNRISIHKKYKKAIDKINETGMQKSLSEIADNLKISKKILIDTISKQNSEYIEDSLAEVTPSRAFQIKEEIENRAVDSIMIQKVMEIMDSDLSEREVTIIRGRFGIDGKEKTLQELAKELHISYEYVRLLQERAIVKVRKTLTGEKQ